MHSKANWIKSWSSIIEWLNVKGHKWKEKVNSKKQQKQIWVIKVNPQTPQPWTYNKDNLIERKGKKKYKD